MSIEVNKNVVCPYCEETNEFEVSISDFDADPEISLEQCDHCQSWYVTEAVPGKVQVFCRAVEGQGKPKRKRVTKK